MRSRGPASASRARKSRTRDRSPAAAPGISPRKAGACCSGIRPAPASSRSTTSTTPISTSSIATRCSSRGCRRRSPSWAEPFASRPSRSGPSPAGAPEAARHVLEEDARDSQAFVDRWRPRVDAMANARHGKLLRTGPGRDAGAEAVLRAGAGRTDRSARPPRRLARAVSRRRPALAVDRVGVTNWVIG